MNYSVQIKTSAQAARLLRDHLDDLDHEELWGIYLTGCGYLINAEMLTKGTLTCTPIDARTVIKRALMNNAAAVIIVHNHPSGNPRPSVNDITQTDHIRKGEKSRMVVFWTQLVKEDSDDLDTDGEPRRKVIPYLKYYNVWNIDQCEGITARWTKTADASAEPKVRPAEAAEAIVAGYLAQPSHPKLILMAGDRAFYRPSTDEVVVPVLSQYDSSDEYYSTLFHELGHSTGHKDRLNRKGVAEITAAMLVSQASLAAERAFKNSVAYLQSWLRALKDDSKMIVWAAGKAEAAARFILRESCSPLTTF